MIIGMILALALSLTVVALVAVPARREGRDLLTPQGEQLVQSARERTTEVAQRRAGEDRRGRRCGPRAGPLEQPRRRQPSPAPSPTPARSRPASRRPPSRPRSTCGPTWRAPATDPHGPFLPQTGASRGRNGHRRRFGRAKPQRGGRGAQGRRSEPASDRPQAVTEQDADAGRGDRDAVAGAGVDRRDAGAGQRAEHAAAAGDPRQGTHAPAGPGAAISATPSATNAANAQPDAAAVLSGRPPRARRGPGRGRVPHPGQQQQRARTGPAGRGGDHPRDRPVAHRDGDEQQHADAAATVAGAASR